MPITARKWWTWWECHATATVQGDLEEIKALKNFYANGRRVMLSSFKSQIGHCLGASGINNLIRGVMALQDGLYPHPELSQPRFRDRHGTLRLPGNSSARRLAQIGESSPAAADKCLRVRRR